MMIIYFHAIVILSVVLSSVFLLRWNRTIAVHFPMIFLLIPIINVGYLRVATSQNIYEALMANGIEYLDGCFLELVFFLYIMSFCKLKVPKALTAALLVMGTAVFFFAINDAKIHLLYTSAELEQTGGVSYIIKEYGVVHTAYYILIAFYLAANLAAIIYSFTRRNVSKINSLLLLMIYLFIIFAFLAGKVFSPAFELLPMSYTFAQIIFLIVMSKINLYDISASVVADISERGKIGFAIFDTKMRYLGSSEPALLCLPELDTLYIDKIITRENEVFGQILDSIERLKADSSTPFFYVSKNGVTYKVTASYFYSGSKIKGYRLMTEDNTYESRMLETLKLRERQKEMEAQMLRLEKSASEAANKAKSSFLAQMSHEIRTPLNAVLGMNEMILRESREPETIEYAANVSNSGRTLLQLINSILDLSKIEDGKMEIIPARYKTAELIGELVQGVSERAADKGLEFTVEADESLPSELKGDDVRISQIISNLLTNAVKYTEKGFVKFIIKEQSREGSSIDLYVEVTDSGIGIKDEDKALLFESFKRLDEQRNRNIEGTGLGMSIVTRLLDMMGSSLDVKSVYGEGSSFSFVLRQEIVSSEPMGSYTEHPELHIPDISSTLYTCGAKVLVVDDNAMNLKVADKLLGIFGIAADMADSGKAALEKLQANSYDIIFLDHMMPEMNGIEVLHEIKEKSLVSDETVIIALTANAIAGAEQMYRDEGFDGYLTKPIAVDRLEQMLIEHLPESKMTTDRKGQAAGKVYDILTLDDMKRIRDICPELNITSGMGYCMDSKEFWLDTLSGFVQADKSQELCKAYESGDTERYGITAHSIKSAAKTIGAQLLSEKARLLEFAAKNDNKDYISDNHDSFVHDYRNMTESITRILQK